MGQTGCQSRGLGRLEAGAQPSCTPLHRWQSRGRMPQAWACELGGWGGLRLQGLGQRTKHSETMPSWEPCCPGPHRMSLADGGPPRAVCRLARSAALASAQPPSPSRPFPQPCLSASRTLIPSHCLLHLTHPPWAASGAGRAHQSEHPVTRRELAGATSEPVQAWPPVPARLVCTSLSEHWALFVHSRAGPQL